MEARITAQLPAGYHVNSNTPNDEYLVPLRLTWDPTILQQESIVYPKPQTEHAGFTKKPLSVFTGDFDIVTKFKVPAPAPAGPGIVTGKLRYQACNETMCFPPKTVDVKLPVDIKD